MAMSHTPATRKAPALPSIMARRQHLAFGLGGELFAMGIRHVKEVIQFGEMTRVPLMPPFVRGVINLRGAVVPVIDLSIRFGREATDASRRTCVVILDVPRGDALMVLGILVDNVSEVLSLADSEIEPPPALGNDPRARFILGIGKTDERFVILLDVARILSESELSELADHQVPEVP